MRESKSFLPFERSADPSTGKAHRNSGRAKRANLYIFILCLFESQFCCVCFIWKHQFEWIVQFTRELDLIAIYSNAHTL